MEAEQTLYVMRKEVDGWMSRARRVFERHRGDDGRGSHASSDSLQKLDFVRAANTNTSPGQTKI